MVESAKVSFEQSDILDVCSLVSDDSEVWLFPNEQLPLYKYRERPVRTVLDVCQVDKRISLDVSLIENISEPHLYESGSFSESMRYLSSNTESFQSFEDKVEHNSLLIQFNNLKLNDTIAAKPDLQNTVSDLVQGPINSPNLQFNNDNVSENVSENEYLTASSSLSDDDTINDFGTTNYNNLMASTPMVQRPKIVRSQLPIFKSKKFDKNLDQTKVITKENEQILSNITNVGVKTVEIRKVIDKCEELKNIDTVPVVQIDKKFVSKIPQMSRIPKLKSSRNRLASTTVSLPNNL